MKTNKNQEIEIKREKEKEARITFLEQTKSGKYTKIGNLNDFNLRMREEKIEISVDDYIYSIS